MKCTLTTPPTIEPITLSEAKEHLRIDSDTFAGNVGLSTCIPAGSHPVVTGYTLVGTGVNVAGKEALVYLQPVNNGTGGTVDVKIQESDDNITFTDWTGGAFTQVTEANDTVIQEKEYTGAKAYIRTAAKTLVAACEFGTAVLVNAATTAEDDLLTSLIQASREHVEDITRRALLTQTWEYYLDEFPEGDFIKLPFGNLQTITSIKCKDTDGAETTMTAGTDYIVETNGEEIGRVVLPYGQSWPSGTLYPSNPITIKFDCGWTAAASIPAKIITALKLILADLWENREGKILSNLNYQENKAVAALLASARLFDEF